ncbi:MAG: hypothetical protein QM638_13740 [Nocardioides sp.]|uniref:hypothetical protein n=1 Tax=Nocardioides sp. TaxID=35761 RepID=UPI0039E42C86
MARHQDPTLWIDSSVRGRPRATIKFGRQFGRVVPRVNEVQRRMNRLKWEYLAMVKLMFARWMMSRAENFLDALEDTFSRWSLDDEPGLAQVIVCLPNTLIHFNEPVDNTVIDTINDSLGGVGHCDEIHSSPRVEKYYVYGDDLEAMASVVTQVCIEKLGRSDAYLLCTAADRSVVNRRRSV